MKTEKQANYYCVMLRNARTGCFEDAEHYTYYEQDAIAFARNTGAEYLIVCMSNDKGKLSNVLKDGQSYRWSEQDECKAMLRMNMKCEYVKSLSSKGGNNG